jgi:hypothetical protein
MKMDVEIKNNLNLNHTLSKINLPDVSELLNHGKKLEESHTFIAVVLFSSESHLPHPFLCVGHSLSMQAGKKRGIPIVTTFRSGYN